MLFAHISIFTFFFPFITYVIVASILMFFFLMFLAHIHYDTKQLAYNLLATEKEAEVACLERMKILNMHYN